MNGRALASREQVLGKGHPSISASMSRLADVKRESFNALTFEE
jgi:hypothetical protein